MNTYDDQSRWLILQYRPGTGGKFLCACLMTLECVAHWDPRVEYGEISYKEWVNTQWNFSDQTKWIAFEPLHSWDLTFFSRTFPRGEEFSLTEFDSLVDQQSSQYFREVWKSNKLVLDFLNKQSVPKWWANAKKIKLDALSASPYHRQFLLGKIYPYDKSTGVGTVMMDKPLDENKYQNARVFKNPYEFGPFSTEEDWYNFIWSTDFRLNFNINDPDVLLEDLISWDSLLTFMQTLEKNLNTKLNIQDLNYVFEYWIQKNSLTEPK